MYTAGTLCYVRERNTLVLNADAKENRLMLLTPTFAVLATIIRTILRLLGFIELDSTPLLD